MAEPPQPTSRTEQAVDRAFGLGWRSGSVLHRRTAARAFDAGADLAWRRGGSGVEQLRANLRRVVGPELGGPDLDLLVRRGLRSYARYFREAFWMPRAAPGLVAARTQMNDSSHVRAIYGSGRGVICALPHSGNWDAAAVAYLAQFPAPMYVVAERLRPESTYRRFQVYRESLGMQVLPLSGASTVPELRRVLRDGGTICLVCDRDISANGVPVEFFGETITVPPGPALLAIRTGAALVPALPGFDGEDWTLQLGQEIPVSGPGIPKRMRDRVSHVMSRLLAEFECGIATAPQDWHMVQRLWRADVAAGPVGRP